MKFFKSGNFNIIHIIITILSYVFLHLLDNSIFAPTFSPESIFSIIRESRSSDLVSDLRIHRNAS